MSGTIIPHARFLEVRQRRQVVDDVARRAITTPGGDLPEARRVTVDPAPGDEHCDARSAPATTGAKDSVGRD